MVYQRLFREGRAVKVKTQAQECCDSCGDPIDRSDVTPELFENMKTRCRDCVLGVVNWPDRDQPRCLGREEL